jgi:membrane protein
MKTLALLARRTIEEFNADNCTHMAAAISYYVLFSVIPLTVFLVSVFGFIMRDAELQEEVIERLLETLPLETEGDQENLVRDTVEGVKNVSAPLTVVGILGMLWSASAMFGAIRKSLNIAWDLEKHRPVVQQKLVDLGMVLGLGLLLVASVAGTGFLRTLRELSDENLGPLSEGTGFIWSVLPFFLPAVLTFAVFMLLYRYVPSAETHFRDVWPGALLSTILFELVKNLFTIYVANFGAYDLVYGALGGILLFLTWTYLTAIILLVGAELASEYPRVLRGDYAETAVAVAKPRETLAGRAWRLAKGLVVHEKKAVPRPRRRPGPGKQTGGQ